MEERQNILQWLVSALMNLEYGILLNRDDLVNCVKSVDASIENVTEFYCINPLPDDKF